MAKHCWKPLTIWWNQWLLTTKLKRQMNQAPYGISGKFTSLYIPDSLRYLNKVSECNRTFKIYLETTRQQCQLQLRNKMVNSIQSVSFQKRLKKIRTLPHWKTPHHPSESTYCVTTKKYHDTRIYLNSVNTLSVY